MSQSTSILPSPFPNVLYNPMAVDAAANTDIQAKQQIGATNMEMVGRAAGSLLGMSEPDAAAAYPAMVKNLQSQGFAMNAPADYPGHAALTSIVNSSIPVEKQYQYGIISPPGLADAIARGNQPLPGVAGGGAGTGGSAGGGPSGGGSFMDALANIESGDKNIVSGTDKDSKGLTLAQGGNPAEISQGNFQISTPTWHDFAKQAGVDINQYPTAMSAPRAVQAQVASVIPFNRFGPRTQTLMRSRFGPLDTSQTVGALAGTPALALNPNTAGPRVGGTATVAAPPPLNPNAGPRVTAVPGQMPPPLQTGQTDAPPVVTPSPLALRTGGTDVAGPGAGPDTTLPPLYSQNQAYQTGIPGITIGGAASPLAPSGTTPASLAAPAIPVASAAAQAPPDTSPPPTGVNSPQFQAAMELNRRAAALLMQYPMSPVAQQQAAAWKAQAALYMQADKEVEATRGGVHGQISQLTGQFTPDPARRMVTRADGSVINDQGQIVAPALSNAVPPLGGYDAQKEAYEGDRKDLTQIAAAGQQAQSSQIRLQTMLDLIPKISTGAGGVTRAQLASLAETAGFPGIAQTLIAHSSDGDASAAQEFSKLTLASAGAAERGDLGSRGSLGAIRLYQQANPNLDLRPGANKAVIGMQLIASQADADYAQAALSFGNKYGNDFRTGSGPYVPLTTFDQQWQQQRNPQIYSAAMGALAGQPVSQWANGLSAPEYKRALDVVSRASPSAVVNGKSGRISMQPNQPTAAPSGGGSPPVVARTPAEAQALPPGTTYTTPDGRTFTR